MTIDEIEDLAIAGKPMPDNLENMSQINLFQAFRNLYSFAARVGMPREQGTREKAEIIKTYKIGELNEKLLDSTNKLWKAIEIAGAAYCANPCVETADTFYEAVYGGARRKQK
ncbi:MAG: hypothetical protein IJ960_06855 [Oscillospiraceae bacterium]|nr:hypothetical protein [Oscillospiraceae bacterium]